MSVLPQGSVASNRLSSSNRLEFIDVARGTAMLLVLLSHFAATYFANDRDPVPSLMILIGMIASPTFIIINGMLLGLSFRGRAGEFDRLRIIFTDRGIFLLTIGHLVLIASQPFYAVRFVSITDTVGVCMLVSPWVVMTLRPYARLVLCLALYLLTLMVVLLWHPTAHFALVLKETFFGSVSLVTYQYAFPVLPWFTLNASASALGEYLGAYSHARNHRAMHRLLIGIAAIGIAVAATLNGTYHLLKQSGYAAAVATHALGSPFAKMPPSLVYFLFYGAIGLMLISACLRLTEEVHVARLVRCLATIGRTSFAVFVFQSFVYFTLMLQLRRHLPLTWAWPVYFVVSVSAIVASGFVWHRADCNRFLTVGYRRWVREREATRGEREGPFATTLPASFARLGAAPE
jgi:peptidoglycan/LPS O-acetylase OafA/YrhL